MPYHLRGQIVIKTPGKKKTTEETQKAMAREVLTQGRGLVEVARDYNVSPATVDKYVRQARQGFLQI